MNQFSFKRSGLYMLLIFITAMAGAIVALSLYWTAGIPFLPWSNYISEMSVGPRGINIVFILMMALMALLGVPFFLFFTGEFKDSYGQKHHLKIALFAGLAGSADMIVMLFFPLDPQVPELYRSHIITGIILFLCMAVYLAVYGRMFLSENRLPSLAGFFASAASLLSLLFAVLLFLTEFLNLLPAHWLTYLIEWGAFSFFCLWMISGSLYLRKV